MKKRKAAKPRRSIRADHDQLARLVADVRREVAAVRRSIAELRDYAVGLSRRLDEPPDHTIAERLKAIEVTMGNGTLERRALDAMRRAIGANEIKFTRLDPKEYPT